MKERDFDEEYMEEEEAIDISKYVGIVKDHRKTILKWVVAAFVLGCIVALDTPRTYTVTTKLAPELSSGAANRLSSLANMVGMSALTLGTTDAVYPMVYPEIIKSNEFLADLFEVPVSVVEDDETLHITLYEYLAEHQKSSLLGAVMSVPFALFNAVLGLFEKKEWSGEVMGENGVNFYHFTKEQGRVAKMLSHCIEATIDKKTLVVTLTVTMQDAEVCALVAKAVNDNLKDYVTEYRTEKAKKDCDYYEKLYEEARESYYSSLRTYANYTDSHQGFSMKSYMVESERLKNEAALRYQLYNTIAQQLQTARAKVQQETPVFAEIIPPSVPLKPSNSRKKTALAFAFLGLVLGTGYVLWKYRGEGDEK